MSGPSFGSQGQAFGPKPPGSKLWAPVPGFGVWALLISEWNLHATLE